MGHLSDKEKERLKTDGAKKFKEGKITIRQLAKEYGVSVPTAMWHLGYRPPSKRNKMKSLPVTDKNSIYPGGAKMERQQPSYTEPKAAVKIDTGSNRAALIMGTPAEIAEIIRELNGKF